MSAPTKTPTKTTRRAPLPRRNEFVFPVPAVRVRTASVLGGAVLGVLLFIGVALEVSLGDYSLPLGQVIEVLLGGGKWIDRLVIIDENLPRALVALGVGLALGAAGAITQTLARNPLASPDVIGISMGSCAAAVSVVVVYGTSLWNGWGVPVAAMLGGVVTAAMVVALAWRNGIEKMRMVLVGVGVNALAAAVVSLMLVRSNLNQAADAVSWLAGSLTGRTWDHVVPLWAVIAAGALVLLASSYHFRILRLGDANARSLGVPLHAMTIVLWTVAVLLTSVAVAASGPIGFVALAGPQLARLLFRSPTPPIIGGALTGAALLIAADLIANQWLGKLPVGVVTGGIGAPFLLFLIVMSNRKVTV